MMISRLSDVMNGTYAARIQDALGRGAGVTITNGPNGGLQFTGRPDGEGLKILAAERSSAKQVTTGKDVISLSPEAKAKIEQLNIAISILGDKDSTLDGADKDQPATGEGGTVAAAAGPAAGAIDASDVGSLALEDPTQVIKDVVGAAQAAVAQISTSEGFHAAAASDPSLVESFAKRLPDDLGASFIAAVGTRTLDVQSGNTAGYNVGGGLLLTGLSGSYVGGTSSGQFDRTKNTVCTSFGFGDVVFSWPKTGAGPQPPA